MFLLKRCLIKKVWSPLRSLASAWRTRAQVKPGGAAWDGAAVPLSRRACKWRFSQNSGEAAGISPPPAACPGVLTGTTIAGAEWTKGHETIEANRTRRDVHVEGKTRPRELFLQSGAGHSILSVLLPPPPGITDSELDGI